MTKRFLFALLILLFSSPAWAANDVCVIVGYYKTVAVGADCSDVDSGDTSGDAQDAIAAAGEDGTVYLYASLAGAQIDGDNILNLTHNGQSIIGIGTVVLSNTSANIIDSDSKTGVTIDNVGFSGATTSQVKLEYGSNSTLIQNCAFADGVEGVRILTTDDTTTSDIDILNNTFATFTQEAIAFMQYDVNDDAAEQFYDINIQLNVFTDVSNAVEIWANDISDVDPGNDGVNATSRSPYNFVFSNNTVTNATDAWLVFLSGLKEAGTGNFIQNNTFNGAGGATASFVNGIQCQWCRDLLVSDNTMTGVNTDNCDGGAFIFDYTGDEALYSDGVTFTRNKVYSNSSTGCLGSGIILFRAKDCTISNNLIYSNDIGIKVNLSHANGTGNKILNNTIVSNTDDGILFNHATGQVVTVTNNIIWDNGEEQIDNNSANDPVVTYTVINAADYSGFAHGAGEVTSDPLFVDAAAGNFRLQANSPAIDVGTLLSLHVDGWEDIYGSLLLCGDGVDIGGSETCSWESNPKLRLLGAGVMLAEWYSSEVASGAFISSEGVYFISSEGVYFISSSP